MSAGESSALSGGSAFVPGFSEDVFISYAHMDNSAQWVTAVHERLRTRVAEILGHPIRIWRDAKLGGADAFWNVIEDRLSKAALLVSVLTPRYVQSEACRREVDHFYHNGHDRLMAGNTSRIIRVIKTPYSPHPEPAPLRQVETLGFPFYRVDPQDSQFHEYAADKQLPEYGSFYSESEKLAQTIARILDRMRSDRVAKGPVKTAYVAYTSSDRLEARDTVINTLRSRGFEVAHPISFPASSTELKAVIETGAPSWDVAVHIMGGLPGAVYDDASRPLVRLQYELVRKTPTKPSFRQLVWIPDDLGAVNGEHGEWVNALAADADQRTEVVRNCSLSSFIEAVCVLLARKFARKRVDSAKSVFLMYTREDCGSAEFKALRNCLHDRGVPFEDPAFDDDPELIEQLRKESIASTDAAVIYYGSCSDAWVQLMRTKLKKTLAELETRDGYVRSIYLCVPPTDLKRNKYLEAAGRELLEGGTPSPLMVLGDCEPFTAEKLDPLLHRLTEGGQ